MSSWKLNKAPTWAPDAVATDRGWVDPKNGDILVSCKRLENAVSYLETFGKGVTPKKQRGGKRPGAGRKTDAQRAEIAKQKIESGEKVSQGEAKALEKIYDVTVDEKQVMKPKRTRKKPTTRARKKPVKKETETKGDTSE